MGFFDVAADQLADWFIGSRPAFSQSIRALAVANDGGRWVFEPSGRPFGFENVDRYGARRKADRFTPKMLREYLRSLGVPLDADMDWPGAIVVSG